MAPGGILERSGESGKVGVSGVGRPVGRDVFGGIAEKRRNRIVGEHISTLSRLGDVSRDDARKCRRGSKQGE